MAIPSSPEARIKLFVAVRLLPTPSFKLLRLIPSPQVLFILLFCTVPPVPDAQTPGVVCLIQTVPSSQFEPTMLNPPPPPSLQSPLTALQSMQRFFTTVPALPCA